MRKSVKLILSLGLIPFLPGLTFAAGPASVTIYPEQVIQGEPIMITVQGAEGTTTVKSISFDGVPVSVFTYQHQPTALVGVDLNKKPGVYKVSVALADGRALEKEVTVGARVRREAPLGIPEKLGGNTPASQAKLVTSLAAANQTLANIHTGAKAFWAGSFKEPLREITVTDEYGYSRKTGPYTIAHKGVDFRAKPGTPVLAINRGVVRLSKEYREYGKTVVVDHGLGLMSFYMHLSQIKVNVGELVKPGQIIALSGQTGYAEQPHLHLTVRIGGISIDPLKFFKLFQ